MRDFAPATWVIPRFLGIQVIKGKAILYSYVDGVFISHDSNIGIFDRPSPCGVIAVCSYVHPAQEFFGQELPIFHIKGNSSLSLTLQIAKLGASGSDPIPGTGNGVISQGAIGTADGMWFISESTQADHLLYGGAYQSQILFSVDPSRIVRMVGLILNNL